MKSKTILLIVALAVIVIGGFLAVTRKASAPAPTAETAAPAAPAETAPASAGPAADGMAGMDANAPARQPAAQDCTQYSWDGAKWVCTSGASAGN